MLIIKNQVNFKFQVFFLNFLLIFFFFFLQGMEQGGEESKYFFKLFLSKSDNYEYNDSPSIDENVLSQLTNFTQNYLIIAECPLKLKNHLQDNKFVILIIIKRNYLKFKYFYYFVFFLRMLLNMKVVMLN